MVIWPPEWKDHWQANTYFCRLATCWRKRVSRTCNPRNHLSGLSHTLNRPENPDRNIRSINYPDRVVCRAHDWTRYFWTAPRRIQAFF